MNHHGTSYDDDVYAWAYEQASLLRELGSTRRDLPNALDIENLCEEIEGLARSDLREAASFLRLLLVHLLKVASAPQAYPVDHWTGEIAVFQAGFQTLATRTILRKLDADRIWQLAIGQASAQLAIAGEEILPGLQPACPFSPDTLAAEPFDMTAALTRLHASVAPPRSSG